MGYMRPVCIIDTSMLPLIIPRTNCTVSHGPAIGYCRLPLALASLSFSLSLCVAVMALSLHLEESRVLAVAMATRMYFHSEVVLHCTPLTLCF